MREINTINKRSQDGLKAYFLCSSCEADFSLPEKHFSENLYKNINQNKSYAATIVDETTYHFVISLAWRCLAYGLGNDPLTNYHPEEIDAMRHSEKTVRDYLLKKREDLLTIACFLYPVLATNTTDSEKVVRHVNYAISHDVIAYDNGNIVLYITVPNLIFIVYFRMSEIFFDSNAHIAIGNKIWQNKPIIPTSALSFCTERHDSSMARVNQEILPETRLKLSQKYLNEFETSDFYAELREMMEDTNKTAKKDKV